MKTSSFVSQPLSAWERSTARMGTQTQPHAVANITSSIGAGRFPTKKVSSLLHLRFSLSWGFGGKQRWSKQSKPPICCRSQLVLGPNGETDLLYVVAGPEYWASIPQTRQLLCGRVRRTSFRCEPPKGAGVYVSKQEAVAAATARRQQLVRETPSGDGWAYQLLLSWKVG